MTGRAGTPVPDSWRAVRLGDLADVNCGQWDPADGNPILYLDLTAVASPGRLSPPKELAAEDAPSRARRRVQSGDILVSTVRPYLRGFARVTQAPENLIASTGFAVVTPRPGVDGSLLYHHVMTPSFAGHLEANMTGQAYPAVRSDDVAAYSLFLPPLTEQRAIAAVLDSIDEAIERAEEVIAATDRLRDALLHELLTRGLPGHHTAWRDVPGLGATPACWEVVRLGDVTREPIRNGFSAGAVEEPTGWWLLTLAAVSHRGFVPEGRKPAPIDARVQSCRLVPGDLLVSRSNTSDRVGLAGVYRGAPDNCSYPDLLMRVRLDTTRALVDIVEATLLSARGRTYFQRHARGTSDSMVKITGDILRSFPLPLPPLPEQRAIAATLDSVDLAIEGARAERTALQSSKASTADALLTGRVRVARGG